MAGAAEPQTDRLATAALNALGVPQISRRAGHSSSPGMMKRADAAVASRSNTSTLTRAARCAGGSPSAPSMILAFRAPASASAQRQRDHRHLQRTKASLAPCDPTSPQCQPTSPLAVPGWSPRRMASAIASSSKPGL